VIARPHPLRGPNRFKLGVFSANADGGLAITDVPERWRASWDDNLTSAGIADRAGLEFFLPIARWKGFGGKNRVREWSFETFTWAAGLAAATSRIGIFMTVHVPILHPLYAAKALATVDHISRGRAGLNIVCGWNPREFAMFGVKLVERGYDQAREWLEIIERAYAAEAPFDFDGEYYRLEGVVSRPASVQSPRPVTMNAAFGRSRARLRGPKLRLPVHDLHRTEGRPPSRRGYQRTRAGLWPGGRRLHRVPRRLPRNPGRSRGLL
jgi:FMNH2-dependent dimethyl sulfone monooxygenase